MRQYGCKPVQRGSMDSVFLIDEWNNHTVLAKVGSINAAEQIIAVLEKIIPNDVHAARFGIDAPEELCGK